LYDDYWEDIGTIKAFYDANLSLASSHPLFDFHQPKAPIYTHARFLPPAIVDGATVTGRMIADGCLIGKGATIENSIIGLRCVVGQGVTIRNSIVMGADSYEVDDAAPEIPLGIGSGSVIESAIVDKNCRIGKNVRIANEAGIENSGEDGPCVIRDGIPVVVKDALLSDGWSL